MYSTRRTESDVEFEEPSGTPECCRKNPNSPTQKQFWWERADLRYSSDGLLTFGDTLLPCLVNDSQKQLSSDVPIYVYNIGRIREKVSMLRNALPDATILYAIKANRFPGIVQEMRSLVDGIDVCSPKEAQLAIQNGFSPEKISYTGTSISDADLRFLADHPQIHVNADSLSQLRRLVAVRPNQPIGIRINPEQGIGYRNEKRLVYAQSERPSKFGILREQIPDAVKIASDANCVIDTVHWHVGCGWLAPQLPALFQILETTLSMTSTIPTVRRINLGGGIGIPFQQDDVPLPLNDWAAWIRNHTNRYEIVIEPGSFLVQDAGILLTQVNTVERKRDWVFAGVQAGFNLLMEPVFYKMPCEPVFLQLPEKNRELGLVTFAGNINEAHDMLLQDVHMPIPREGEWLGFLNAGAYGAAMASNHCLRGEYKEFAV
ncbi:MAG: hypothetical protein ACRC2T_18185 [Thermoguttaceae bacterium]